MVYYHRDICIDARRRWLFCLNLTLSSYIYIGGKLSDRLQLNYSVVYNRLECISGMETNELLEMILDHLGGGELMKNIFR